MAKLSIATGSFFARKEKHDTIDSKIESRSV
jgi:hypothetical protein